MAYFDDFCNIFLISLKVNFPTINNTVKYTHTHKPIIINKEIIPWILKKVLNKTIDISINRLANVGVNISKAFKVKLHNFFIAIIFIAKVTKYPKTLAITTPYIFMFVFGTKITISIDLINIPINNEKSGFFDFPSDCKIEFVIDTKQNKNISNIDNFKRFVAIPNCCAVKFVYINFKIGFASENNPTIHGIIKIKTILNVFYIVIF